MRPFLCNCGQYEYRWGAIALMMSQVKQPEHQEHSQGAFEGPMGCRGCVHRHGLARFLVLRPGTKVRTLRPLHDDQYTTEALKLRKWGVTGVVKGHHDSHGLCYDVLHTDGTIGTYDPDELGPEDNVP